MVKIYNILVLVFYIVMLIFVQFIGIQDDFKKYITPVGLVITIIVFGSSIFLGLPKEKLSTPQTKRCWIVMIIVSILLVLIIYWGFFYKITPEGLRIELEEIFNVLGIFFAISSNHLIKWLTLSIRDGF